MERDSRPDPIHSRRSGWSRALRINHFCPTTSVYIIADAGSNHAGDLDTAMALVDATAGVGADAVKFQLFRWEDVVEVPQAQDPRFQLPPEWIPDLAERAQANGLDFLCTPFAPWAVEVLRPYVGAWKIGSFEALRSDLLLATDDKVRIISVGMITEEERLNLMSLHPHDIFLHCVSMYPTRLRRTQMWRMKEMALQHRRWRVGISDHTPGWESVVAAVALGARTVEKHIRLKNNPPSPDNGPWALKPARFKKMVKALRDIQYSLITPRKPEPLPYYEGRKVHWGRQAV